MYQIKITMTGRSYKTKDEYATFDTKDVNCRTFAEVKEYLDKEYGTCKRVKMFRDYVGEYPRTNHVGWIYCFNNSDISHSPVEKWRQQDWVEVVELKHRTIDPKKYS